MYKLAVPLGITLLVIGCASNVSIKKMYGGAARPDSEIARIRVPGDLDVVRVDERTLTYLYTGEPVDIQVLPGRHEIALRYYEIWEVRNDLTKVISDPVSKTLTVRAGGSYQVEHTRPTSLTAAESYAPNFDFTVRESGSAGRIVADSAAPKASHATSIGAAAVVPSLGVGDAAGGSSDRTGDGTTERAPLARLKYWWGQASDHDRQDFRRWIQAP